MKSNKQKQEQQVSCGDACACAYARVCATYVYVSVPPKITTKLISMEGVDGNNVNLSCRGTGLPPPKYEFHKV